MEVRFAGFWIRFFAYVLDGIILSILHSFVFVVLSVFTGVAIPFIDETETAGSYVKYAMQTDLEPFMFGYTLGFLSILGLVTLGINWLYFAMMQSSAKKATLGKAAFGLIVVDENFDRLTFGRATVRYFSKYLSGLILYIGYIMAAFNPSKRALHDIIAGTFVIYNDYGRMH